MNPWAVAAGGVCLAVAGIHDLRCRQVRDRTFLAGLAGVFLAHGVVGGVSLLQSSAVSLAVLAGAGLLLHVAVTWGGADVLALAVVGAAYPGQRPMQVLAVVMAATYGYMLVWKAVLRENTVPAIPGILAGYVAVVAVLG